MISEITYRFGLSYVVFLSSAWKNQDMMFSCRPSGTVEFTAGQQKTVSTTAQPPAHHRWCRDLVLSHPGNPCRAALKVFMWWDTMHAEISILSAVLPSAGPELSKILALKLQHGVGRNMTVCFAYCQEFFFFIALKNNYITLFSALKQTHCAHVTCDSEWVTILL